MKFCPPREANTENNYSSITIPWRTIQKLIRPRQSVTKETGRNGKKQEQNWKDIFNKWEEIGINAKKQEDMGRR